MGDQTVSAGADSIHDENPGRTKAIRKVVRLIIEKEGGDGAVTKRDIFARYPKGKVLWKDVVVALWDENSKKMNLLDKGGVGGGLQEIDGDWGQ